MFILSRIFMLVSMFVLLCAGCAGVSSVDVGLDVSEVAVLDDDYLTEITVEKGESFALDVIVPLKKGHIITGALFDPGMLRMERHIEYHEDGVKRARYLFTVTGDGASDVFIKMAPVEGGQAEVFRKVGVLAGESKGLF